MKAETMEKYADVACDPKYPGLIIILNGGKFPGYGWAISAPGDDTLLYCGGGCDAPAVLKNIARKLEEIAAMLPSHTEHETPKQSWAYFRDVLDKLIAKKEAEIAEMEKENE